MEGNGLVVVEFFGVPRQRAGRAEVLVAPGTVAEVLQAVAQVCPGLADWQQPNGLLAAHYLLSLNGKQFLAEATLPLRPGDRLLVLSADAGG